MNYYKVTAKFGHVGRNNYILLDIYLKAENGKQAAMYARLFPRVKHNHKDAIKKVLKIKEEQYQLGLLEMKSNNYFKCSSKQEQIKLQAVKSDEIMKETEITKYKKNRMARNLRFNAKLQSYQKELYTEV